MSKVIGERPLFIDGYTNSPTDLTPFIFMLFRISFRFTPYRIILIWSEGKWYGLENVTKFCPCMVV